MRLLTVVLLLVLLGPPPASAAAVDAAPASTVRYEPPVPGAVLRGFADPEHAYAPGHRGVDLAADHGAPVASAAAGEVTFAGTVAGRRWVTVAHADGVRTSYGHLAAVHVATGTAVARGQVLGAATGSNGDDPLRPEPGLHWSARRGEVYLDPLSLLGGLPRPTLVGPGGWRGSHLVVQPYAPYEGGSRFAVLAPGSPTAGHRGYARAPNHHHLVQLPGYGTEGPHPVLDPGYLGYGPGDSSEFSYRGCDPTPLGCSGHPYGGTDTDLTVDDAAALLDQHLRAQQRAQPGRPVDLLGHSMGGDVATHYLTYLYDPTDPGLPPIGSLITIGTPHGGSGVGYLARAVGDDALLGHPVEAVRRLAVAIGAEGADRVGFGSEPLARYGTRGGRPDRDPDRLAALGVRVLEIAGSRDLVVGREDAGSVGPAVVLPGGHGTVTGVEATYLA
ncbi:MAG: peptidoglycan DD-metalloendopeptidase family protein, partial [Nitriliruptor sp.]